MGKLKNQINNITIRNAEWKDVDYLLALRNDPSSWSQYIQSRPISQEEHYEWFRGVLKRNDVKVFIILAQDVPVGQIRYEIKQDEVFVSIAVEGDQRGKGYGFQALKHINQKIFSLPNVTVLKALVLGGNNASLACFKKAGYIPIGKEKHENKNFILMEFKEDF